VSTYIRRIRAKFPARTLADLVRLGMESNSAAEGQAKTAGVTVADAIAYYANGSYPADCADAAQETVRWENPEWRCIVDMHGETWKRYYREARRTAWSEGFEFRWDTSFADAVDAGSPGRESNCGPVFRLYQQLYQAGAAHSVETWCNGELAGSVIYVSMGRWLRLTMPLRAVSSAVNAAVAAMATKMLEHGCVLFDVQGERKFTKQIGGVMISRERYLALLRTSLDPTAVGA
jgi:leucyl/phenylalanyl-tRNA--protein transferase